MGRPKNNKSSFWKKVAIGLGSECWEWQTGKDKDGYGVFWINDKSIKAHRFSYELYHGSIPCSFLVCHSCDNPGCVNPDHLFIGSQIANIKDRHKKGRDYRPSGSDNINARLTNEQVIKIRTFCEEGMTRKELSVLFNVSRSQIEFIVRGKAWSHIGGPLQETNRRESA